MRTYVACNHSLQAQPAQLISALGTRMQQNRPRARKQTKAERIEELETALRTVLDWHDQPEDKDPLEWAEVVRLCRTALRAGGAAS